uniref:Uncharacterized protein n=1 Tax=Otus sunia TaxID=257818 RepID=A0A8C8ABJ0_9STRI
MRASMDWPFSRHFSISMSSFTPSTTICTSSTSEKPRRSALETSNTPPTAAVSTPPAARDGVSTLTTARASESTPLPSIAPGGNTAIPSSTSCHWCLLLHAGR